MSAPPPVATSPAQLALTKLTDTAKHVLAQVRVCVTSGGGAVGVEATWTGDGGEAPRARRARESVYRGRQIRPDDLTVLRTERAGRSSAWRVAGAGRAAASHRADVSCERRVGGRRCGGSVGVLLHARPRGSYALRARPRWDENPASQCDATPSDAGSYGWIRCGAGWLRLDWVAATRLAGHGRVLPLQRRCRMPCGPLAAPDEDCGAR